MDMPEAVIRRSYKQTKRISFMFSCRLNGIVNAQIARGVMQIYYGELPQQKEYSSEAYMRINFFSDISETVADRNNFLLGVAFAQNYVNGYGNVLYPPAFLFSKEVKTAIRPYFQRAAANSSIGQRILSATPLDCLSLVSPLITIVTQEKTEGLEELLTQATSVSRREIRDNEHYVAEQKNELSHWQKGPYTDAGKLYTSPKQAVIAGITLVEGVNPLQNAYVRQKLLEKDSSVEKVAIVLDASKHFFYPNAFIAGVETAQRTAVVSDAVGITLFEYTTPRLRRSTAFQEFLEWAKENYKERLKNYKK